MRACVRARVASLRLWRMGCQSFRENIFGKCGGFLAVVYHIFLMLETVFDDRGPPGNLLEDAVLCMCEKQGGISNDEAIFDVEQSDA